MPNEKLQKTYYIIGIIQRITMIFLTFAIMGGAYKIYNYLLTYGVEIKEMHILLQNFYNLIDRSWLF
jgi:hypothetical protein